MSAKSSFAVGLFVWLSLVASAQTFPYLPESIHPGAGSDAGDDWWVSQAIDSRGVIHAVWRSTNDYTGSAGSDGDIFYSCLDGVSWSAPILVNSYGTVDSGDDLHPRLIVGPGDVLHCVWESSAGWTGSGGDGDIFYAQKSGAWWSDAELVNEYGALDNFSPSNVDSNPTIALTGDGRPLAAWQSDYPDVSGGIGTDWDILYSVRTGGFWSAAAPLNTNAAFDTGNDLGPASMATTADGAIVAAWSTDDPLRVDTPIGTDRDIVFSFYPSGGSAWSPILEANAEARGDSGGDRNPAVATIESGANLEVHIVWESASNIGGGGWDYDIAHTEFGAFGFGLPLNTSWLVNSNATTDSIIDDDLAPSLCVEPGGVLHCAWSARPDLGALTGNDYDIFYAFNATRGNAWSTMELASLNGLSDSATEEDSAPDLKCSPFGQLSCAWVSNDDFGPGPGADSDILRAAGKGRGVSRPEKVNWNAETDNATSPNDDQGPNMAIDPQNGVLHVVWASDTPAISGIDHGNDYDIFHSMLLTTGWTAPELVNTNGQTDSGIDYSPSVAITSYGGVVVAWSSNSNIGGAGNDYDIFATLNAGFGWTPPELVNLAGAADGPGAGWDDVCPRVALDSSDQEHVVWQDQYNASTPGSSLSNICFAYRSLSGWSATEKVNSGYPDGYIDENPDLALDSSNNVHVVWDSNGLAPGGAGGDYEIYYAKRGSTGWSATEWVNFAPSDGSAWDFYPSIAIAPNDRPHVVWASNNSDESAGTDGDIWYNSRYSTGWSLAKPVVALAQTDSAQDLRPDLSVDAEGALNLVWQSRGSFPGTGADWDLLYTRFLPGTSMPIAAAPLVANASAFADVWDDQYPSVAVGRDGYAHFVWQSNDTLGGVMGFDSDILHAQARLPGRQAGGAARLGRVSDNGDGSAHLTWTNYCQIPWRFLSFSWDLYTATWVLGGEGGTLWHPYINTDFAGDINLTYSGGYHVWISNQYPDLSWYGCGNPWTGINYSGTPHTPIEVVGVDLGSHQVRLNWKPEIYGTWHDQIIAYKEGSGWVNTIGPSGNALWQFIYYPNSNFMAGQETLTVPGGGIYYFYIRGASWLPPYTPPSVGAYAIATVTVAN